MAWRERKGWYGSDDGVGVVPVLLPRQLSVKLVTLLTEEPKQETDRIGSWRRISRKVFWSTPQPFCRSARRSLPDLQGAAPFSLTHYLSPSLFRTISIGMVSIQLWPTAAEGELALTARNHSPPPPGRSSPDSSPGSSSSRRTTRLDNCRGCSRIMKRNPAQELSTTISPRALPRPIPAAPHCCLRLAGQIKERRCREHIRAGYSRPLHYRAVKGEKVRVIIRGNSSGWG